MCSVTLWCVELINICPMTEMAVESEYIRDTNLSFATQKENYHLFNRAGISRARGRNYASPNTLHEHLLQLVLLW